METSLTYNSNLFGYWNSTEGEKKSISQLDIIKAYFSGREDGRKEAFDEVIKTITNNITKAQNLGESFFLRMGDDGLICHRAYLNVVSIEEFQILYVVDKDLFYSEKMDDVYRKSIEISNEYNTEGFNISLSFMPIRENINISKLVSDGFVFHYDRK